jgi:hypothetical protein
MTILLGGVILLRNVYNDDAVNHDQGGSFSQSKYIAQRGKSEKCWVASAPKPQPGGRSNGEKIDCSPNVIRRTISYVHWPLKQTEGKAIAN